MEILRTPYIVPLGAFLVAILVGIVAIAGGLISEAHSRRLKAEQRMTMIARGMSVVEIERLLGNTDSDKPIGAPKDPLRSLAIARRTGIVLVSAGLGLVIFFVALTTILHARNVLAGAAAGLIPLAIGIGFFIDYNLQKRELSRFGLEIDPPGNRAS